MMWKKHRKSVKPSSTNSPFGLREKGRRHEEQNEQRALLIICDMHLWKWPELRMLYHVPNGGLRSKIEAAIMSALGVKSGVPDLVLPVARRGWFGAYIEMKRPGQRRKTGPMQKWWLQHLAVSGYATIVCDSAESAWQFIKWYLEGKNTIAQQMPELFE